MNRRPLSFLPLLLALSCAREGDENLGLGTPEPARLAADKKQLQKPQGLRQVAAMPPAEAVRRLGSHRLEARTSWQITPPGDKSGGEAPAPQSLQEESLVESDGKGGLHILHNNDHGYGSEAVLVSGQLYLRMRYGPYVRRRPEDDEVPRLLAAAGDTSGALLQLLGPWLKVDEASEAKVAGRPAIKLTLSKQASPQREGRPPRGAVPGRLWRQALSVASLSGAAVVDATEGALLGLRLEASFQAPRGEGGPPVRVEVSHRAAVGALGEAVPVSAPTDGEVIDPPVRPRPMLDHQELLEGLLPRNQHR
jgi:hypothetical protein